MIQKIVHWLTIHEEHLKDVNLSLASGILSVFTLQKLLDWFVHTIGACISAGVVSIFLYFLMRFIKKWKP